METLYHFIDAIHSLGFEFINNTKPGYFWVDKNSDKRLSRTKFTKKILVEVGYDPSKTEDEIMKDIGYLKIYDAGHRIFKWTNK
jgi:hemerythrin